MARSIGKIKIKKLQAWTREEYAKCKEHCYMFNHELFTHNMRKRIPSEWYEIWECGYQEINRVIGDELSKCMYAK